MTTLLSLLKSAWPGMLVGYILGSMSFAVIISHLTEGQDIRSAGSQSAGATNMLRTYGWKAGGMTLLGDLLKGSLSVMIARAFSASEWALYVGYLAALCAVVGHMKPIFFGFKGGKSVATGLGALIVLNPIASGVVLLYAVPIIALSGYVSLGSLSGAVGIVIVQPVIRAIQGRFDLAEQLLLMLLVGLIVYAHRGNILRLKSGTERKFSPNKQSKGGTRT